MECLEGTRFVFAHTALRQMPGLMDAEQMQQAFETERMQAKMADPDDRAVHHMTSQPSSHVLDQLAQAAGGNLKRIPSFIEADCPSKAEYDAAAEALTRSFQTDRMQAKMTDPDDRAIHHMTSQPSYLVLEQLAQAAGTNGTGGSGMKRTPSFCESPYTSKAEYEKAFVSGSEFSAVTPATMDMM